METFKERLKIEYTELMDKVTKLDAFINTDKFNDIDTIQKVLLLAQASAMHTYLVCLDQRLLNLK